MPSDADRSAEDIENEYLTIIASIQAQVKIPVAVKLSPFFTNFAHFARRVDRQGADALVLFNRFYQPDIELETLEISPNILLSTPMAMRLPMRWIAMLYGRIGANLAATSGIHRATDALKMLMAGADVTMLCSVLLRRGIKHIAVIEREMREWMEEHEYESVEQLKGSMSQKNCPDPGAFERAQYMRALATYPTAEALNRDSLGRSLTIREIEGVDLFCASSERTTSVDQIRVSARIIREPKFFMYLKTPLTNLLYCSLACLHHRHRRHQHNSGAIT